MKHLLTALTASAAVSLVMSGGALAKEWYPYPVEVWDPPFDMASPRTSTDCTPLEKNRISACPFRI